MIELAPNTPKDLNGPILKLYHTLFDPREKFTNITGLKLITDEGLLQTNNNRKLTLEYKNQTYQLEIFHYVRDNGNCLAIANPQSGNLIQLVFERFARNENGTLKISHDGSITGAKGSNKQTNLLRISERASSLKMTGDYTKVLLGDLPKTYTFKDSAFQTFLSKLIIYSLERKEIKNMLIEENLSDSTSTLSPFKNFIETLIQRAEIERPSAYYFNKEVYNDTYIWVSDHARVLNDNPAHYEIILRNVEKPLKGRKDLKICIDIHFEKSQKDTKKIMESLGELPERILEIDWQEGKSLSYFEHYDLSDPDLADKVITALDYFRYHIQDKLITIINQEYHSLSVNKLLVNLTWNSNNWQSPSGDKSNHDWVKNGGTPMESWNFDKEAQWNTPDTIYGSATFTNSPKFNGPAIFVFHSQNKIVGFYGDAALCNKKIGENEKNLQGRKEISFVLQYKIENVKESGYFEDKQRIGQIGFNYIQKDETVMRIIEQALVLNPDQSVEINALKNWFKGLSGPLNSQPTFMKQTRNQILYGPPGTGKTYHTINKALEILAEKESLDLDWTDRKAIKDLYDAKIKSGQIVFTTFHQSLGYEDFIEGIKPQKPVAEGSPISYLVEPGLFKTICENATSPMLLARQDAKSFQSVAFFKMSLGGKLRPDIHEYCLDHNLIGLGYGNDEDFSALTAFKTWESFRDAFKAKYPDLAAESKYTIQALYIFQRMKIGDIVVITKGNQIIDAVGRITGEYEYKNESPIEYHQFRRVEWMAKNINQSPDNFFGKNISQQTIYEFYPEDVKKEAFKQFFKDSATGERNYVMIIDEINRGNVSSIFGELITCIEDSKRIGQSETIKITLPYSKESFGVPDNVYIIGTMNTADRSVEALDTALRRRFNFTEMLPQHNHELITSVEGIDLKDKLRKINLRLEKLLSRDHSIGHSFLLSLSGHQGLYNAFYNKIIPLLQEYFFGDYGKIGLVLGSAFITEDPDSTSDIDLFASFDYQDVDLLMEKKVYRIEKFEKDVAGFLNAVRNI
jgi:hypothetical protein